MQVFAGIDGVAPVVHGTRRDQHARSKHIEYWRTDFDHVLELGMRVLRWGANWYQTNPAPHRYDWSHLDDRIEYAAKIGLTIWYVLQHKQVPDWIEIDHPEFPHALCEYGEAVAQRYPHLATYFVTVEPDFYARMACLDGLWQPHRTDCYELALDRFEGAIRISAEAIKRIRPHARIIHCDFAPGLAFAKRVAAYVDALALDYYPWAHGRTLAAYVEEWYAATRKPLYIAETGLAGGHCHHDAQAQARYVHAVFAACRTLQEHGVDLRGVCIYPTVTDNFYWGSNQCAEYPSVYPPHGAQAHLYEGDNAGGFYRFLAGTLERIPVPEMIQALQDEHDRTRGELEWHLTTHTHRMAR